MDERKVFHLPLIVFILEVYDYLHPVFLPVPDVVHEEQMLRQLPYLQLGLCHDVYAAVLCEKKLYVEPAGIVDRFADPLGSDVFPASRKVFGEHKRFSAVQKLFGKAVFPQKAADFPVAADRKILF